MIASSKTKQTLNGHIVLPLPSECTEGKYFEDYTRWPYFAPSIQLKFGCWIHSKGYSTDLFFKPLPNIAPWKDFYKGFTKKYFIGEILRQIPKRKLSISTSVNFYLCVNEFSNNYFHFVTEVLPKMLYVKEYIDPTATFFFPFSLSAYQLSILNLCKISYKTTDNFITLFSKIKIVENFTHSPGCYHPMLLNTAKECVIKSTSGSAQKNRRIYVTRNTAVRRRVMNEDAVVHLLSGLGFEIMDFDTIDFIDQVKIMKSTSVFLSIHGAALTNMLFLPTGATVVELLPQKGTKNDKCYFALASVLGLKYCYQFCEMIGDSHITSDYKIDTVPLAALLNKILSVDPQPD